MERGELLPTATADKGQGASVRAAADIRDSLACMSTGGRREKGRKGGMEEDGGRDGAMPPRP